MAGQSMHTLSCQLLEMKTGCKWDYYHLMNGFDVVHRGGMTVALGLCSGVCSKSVTFYGNIFCWRAVILRVDSLSKCG
jgi:hypothetical protein